MKRVQGLFSQPMEILGRVSASLKAAYPAAQAELFLKGQGVCVSHKHAGPLDDMLMLFDRHCKRCPGVWLLCDPEHPYGMVARATCSCEAAASPCAVACRTDSDRPSAMLCVTQASGKDVLIGSRSCGCAEKPGDPHRTARHRGTS